MFSISHQKLFLTLLTGAFCFASIGNLAQADIRVSHDATHVNVEASNLDCKLPDKRLAFLEIANKFAKLITALQEKFKDTPWEDLAEIQQEEIHNRIENAITDFYSTEEQITATPLVFGDSKYPRTDRMPSSFPSVIGAEEKLSNLQKLRPQAMYVTISLNLTNTAKYSADEVRRMEEAVTAAAGNKAKALVDVNGGVTLQIGLVAVPTCTWYAEKGPRKTKSEEHRINPGVTLSMPAEEESTVINGPVAGFFSTSESEKSTTRKQISKLEQQLDQSSGTMAEGWYSGSLSNFVVRPIIFFYARGGVGKEFEKSSKWWQRISGGTIFGDLNRVTDINGYFFGGSGDIGFKVGNFQPGANWKAGCIRNPQLEKTIPYCGNFVFTNVRWDPKNLGKDGINFHYNVKGEFGAILIGTAAIRYVLTLFNNTPESIDETIESLSWLLGENDEHNLKLQQQKMNRQ